MYGDTTILLIEDNPGDKRLVSEVLRETEYASAKLFTASSLAEEEMLPVNTNGFAMILLDLNLPDSQGLDTLREIRKRHKDSAIVILTGLDNNDIASEALREGAQSYITKDELNSRILGRNIKYSIERQQFIVRLQQMTEDLIERNKELEQFTFIVSHNLRAPVANIMGIEQMLKITTLSQEEKEKLFSGLYKSTERLNDVVSDLNEILKAKKGANSIRENVYFKSITEEVWISINNIIEENQAGIETDFQAESIYTIKSYLYSILYNLISNSIKFRKKDERPLIKISTTKEKNGTVVLVYNDNGIGIDMALQKENVFGLYKRFHRHVEGKGIGLFMVKTQVESLGGKVTLESEPDKGTSFTIVFPKS